MKFTVQQIAYLLNGEIQGDNSLEIDKLGKIDEPSEVGSICFLANPKYENFIYTTNATAVIVNRSFVPKKQLSTTLILVEDAYVGFNLLLKEYEKLIKAQWLASKIGIESPSFLSESVQYGKGFYLGAFAYIGKNCVFGNNVKIFPQTYIGDNVKIDDNSIIHAGVKIYDNTIIGKNCTLHAGSIIGSDGFGFAKQKDGTYDNIPQLGNVILEDNVSIGANTTVDRATLGVTLIKQGTKLDNLIQIGHNVVVGANTVIAAQAGVSGSTKIGDNCAIGGQVGLAGHIEIAENTQIGAQAGVNSSVKESGKVIIGSPAIHFKDFFKSSVIFKRLPDLQKRLEELEEKILNLPLS